MCLAPPWNKRKIPSARDRFSDPRLGAAWLAQACLGLSPGSGLGEGANREVIIRIAEPYILEIVQRSVSSAGKREWLLALILTGCGVHSLENNWTKDIPTIPPLPRFTISEDDKLRGEPLSEQSGIPISPPIQVQFRNDPNDIGICRLTKLTFVQPEFGYSRWNQIPNIGSQHIKLR